MLFVDIQYTSSQNETRLKNKKHMASADLMFWKNALRVHLRI